MPSYPSPRPRETCKPLDFGSWAVSLLKGNDVKDTKEFFAALSVSERERFLLLSVVLREQDVIRAAENAATEKLTAYNDYALYSHNPHNPPICNGDLDWPGGPFDSIGSWDLKFVNYTSEMTVAATDCKFVMLKLIDAEIITRRFFETVLE